MLVVLKTGLHLHYLVATALAVEAAVVHNFLWHKRFTWVDRTGGARFIKFNLTTGLLSIAGTLVLMKLLVGLGHMNYLLTNGIAITGCSVVNFLVSDGFVFAAPPPARHYLTIEKPMNISPYRLAVDLGSRPWVSPPTVNDIVHEKRGITPEMAIRLAKYFGNSEQFWLNLQDAFAVYHARKKYSKELKAIKTLAAGTATRRGAVRTDIPAAKM